MQSDALSILTGIDNPTAEQILPLPLIIAKPPTQAAKQRALGINRELFALTGGIPPLNQAVLTKKLHLKTAPCQNWNVIKVAPNTANKLCFYMWSKSEKAEDQTWPTLEITRYTDQEYSSALVDPSWTRDETDFLFSLCERYDLRFIVIVDRYLFQNSTRPIEDLRDRYYSVASKVKAMRSEDVDAAYTFDKEREIERKKNLEVLYSRTPEQAAEEEALYVELRKREQTAMKWSRERESIITSLSNYELTLKEGEKKKKVKRTEPRKKLKTSDDLEEEDISTQRKDRNPYGVYLRSTKMTAAKVTMQQKLTQTLLELGINLRPTIPTAAVMTKYDLLRQNALALLDLKRQIDRLDHDIKIAADPDAIAMGLRRTSNAGEKIWHLKLKE